MPANLIIVAELIAEATIMRALNSCAFIINVFINRHTPDGGGNVLNVEMF